MKKSKAETVETRKRIVRTAARVFMEQGIDATPVGEVMVAAGMTQGAFYRHFESKEALLVEATEVAYEQLANDVGHLASSKMPRESLNTIIHAYLYQRLTEGANLCPVANLGAELAHGDDHVKAVTNVGYMRISSYLAALLQQIGIRDHQALATSIFSTLVGAVTISRLSLNSSAAKSVLDCAEKSVAQLIDATLKAEAS